MVAMLLMSNFAMAQRTISGTISDAESGETLIGATVAVVGTSRGTVTDIEGNYSIEVPNGATQMRFSYTGYEEQVVAIGAGNVMNVTLNTSSALDEVVVIGYGTVKKKDATGAVVALTAKDFNQGVVVSPEQMMQGRAAGVQITQASGEPGAGANIRIRGTSSVRGGNNPLFVVDGVPMAGSAISADGADVGFGSSAGRNPLNFLNPLDIASIDVLKDASATAIYGSRGANGVVLITTKKGRNEGSLDYGYALGVSNITQKYDLLSASEFLAANPNATDGGTETDWQDEILRTALTNTHNVAYSQGGAKGGYRVSMGYQNQEGIIKQSGLKKVTLGLNADRKAMNDRLTLGTQFAIANLDDQYAPISDNSGFEGDLLGAALKLNPTQPVYITNADGERELNQIGGDQINPVAMLEYGRDFSNTIRGVGSVFASYRLLDGLTFRTVLGFDRSFSERRQAYSRDFVANRINGIGRAASGTIQQDNRLWENYFSYNTSINDNITLDGVLGYSYQQFNLATSAFAFAKFNTSDLNVMLNNTQSADNVIPVASNREQDELQSYFTRWGVGIGGKYFLTGTVRADGSTRFGGDNKYGIFPSFAGKWRISEEGFLPDLFTDFSLRAGYGRTGNQEIPHNLYLERARFQGVSFDDGGNIQPGGIAPVTFENPELKWETTDQLNVGLDFEINKGKLYGSVDFYDKITRDLLMNVPSAQPAATPFVWRNLDAEVHNTGVELVLGGYPVVGENFSWNIASNVAFNENTIENYTSFVNTGVISGQGLTGAFAQRLADGQPLFAYFLRDFQGFDSEGNSLYGESGTDDFQQFLDKSPLPKVIAGLTNDFTFGKFDASIFFQGQFGHYLYNNTANAYFTQGSLIGGRNVTRDVVGNGEGDFNAPDVSTRFLEKGDFIRLQNMTIGYTVPMASKSVLSNLRVFVTGQNLLTFTDYSGQDPEVDTNKSIDGIPSAGIDYTPFPRARVFTFGANASF